MSKNRATDFICIMVTVLTVIMGCTLTFGALPEGEAVKNEPPYVASLFSTNKVHTVNIVANQRDWDYMIANASNEEYITCSIVIDGNAVKNVAIRPKGNSSLSQITRSDSSRYSFKIEFDHYESGKSYKGLDKLVLNNISQDNTYMKDYVCYQLMNAAEADAPFSSFAYITVNGGDWGLYLAVEAIEDSFANRVYGADTGRIYKPESMEMGNWDNRERDGLSNQWQMPENFEFPQNRDDQMPEDIEFPPNRDVQMPEDIEFPPNRDVQMPEGAEFPQNDSPQMPRFGENGDGMRRRGMEGATTLKYTDDEIASYSAIFDNDVLKNASDADKKRLIASLKELAESVDGNGKILEDIIDTNKVLRYFVVHNFVLNGDSYTGNLVHNYYLNENDGKLSMIAWDYNLAFGGMGMGGMGMRGMGMGMGMGGMGNVSGMDSNQTDATAQVNSPIDTPLSSATFSDRPMLGALLSNETYLLLYHKIYREFLDYFKSEEFSEMYDNAVNLIAPYVDKDPTAFCEYEDFQKGQRTLRDFCLLRAKSVESQLKGKIASTTDGQNEDNKMAFIDASSIDISSMGSNFTGSRNDVGGFEGWGRQPEAAQNSDETDKADNDNAGIWRLDRKEEIARNIEP
ncbi:MAG: CotH kinase family protein [Clostridiales bacterium]|jgi:spore coat protein CotH|nr:CotH kinase family protein [Clostridiales bacterium]